MGRFDAIQKAKNADARAAARDATATRLPALKDLDSRSDAELRTEVLRGRNNSSDINASGRGGESMADTRRRWKSADAWLRRSGAAQAELDRRGGQRKAQKKQAKSILG